VSPASPPQRDSALPHRDAEACEPVEAGSPTDMQQSVGGTGSRADPLSVERRREPSLPLPTAFELRLVFPADPNALAGIRHALGGIAGALGVGPAGIADVRLALTEVCSAAIRGDGGDGELEVRAALQDGALQVVVADGMGFAPGSGAQAGFPLPLVAALTETLELRRVRGGSEVVMTFALRNDAG
jgi:anti-sigma regulatory factor (Ser/Thr protein kinase)